MHTYLVNTTHWQLWQEKKKVDGTTADEHQASQVPLELTNTPFIS